VIVRPLDGASDALIALQGQLIAMLAAQNAALTTRVAELEERLAEAGAGGVAELRQFLAAAVDG
jgi:hypothetical protein